MVHLSMNMSVQLRVTVQLEIAHFSGKEYTKQFNKM